MNRSELLQILKDSPHWEYKEKDHFIQGDVSISLFPGDTLLLKPCRLEFFYEIPYSATSVSSSVAVFEIIKDTEVDTGFLGSNFYAVQTRLILGV